MLMRSVDIIGITVIKRFMPVCFSEIYHDYSLITY